MSKKLSEEQLNSLDELFELYDKDRSGSVNIELLPLFLRAYGSSPSQAECKVFAEKYDKTHDGKLSLDSLKDLVSNEELPPPKTDEELHKAFLAFDKDGSGYVEVEDLRSALLTRGEERPTTSGVVISTDEGTQEKAKKEEEEKASEQPPPKVEGPPPVTTGFDHPTNPYSKDLKGEWHPRALMEVAAALPMMDGYAATFREKPIEELRAWLNGFGEALTQNESNKVWTALAPPEQEPMIVDTTAFPPCDNSAVTVYVHRPSGTAPGGDTGRLPAVLMCHGGGGVFHLAPHYAHMAAKLAATVGAVVFNVEYRLGPDTKMPGGAYDVAGVALTIHRDAETLGVDPERIFVWGDSGGSMVACVTAYELSHKRPKANLPTVPLRGCVAVAPMVSDQFLRQEEVPPEGVELQTSPFAQWYDDALRGDISKEDPAYIYVLNMSEEAFGTFPQTALFTSEFDFFRRPAEHFASKLDKAGRLASFVVHPGVTHDWEVDASYDGAERFWEDMGKAFEAMLSK